MKYAEMINKKTFNIICILLLIILNIIVKSIYIDYSCIDVDEPTTILRATASLPDLISMLKFETNQPLFFIIMHFWIKWFGIGAASLRFLPMLFNSLTVVFVYLIGKKYYNVLVALGASLLFTFSNLNISHAHDARVYGLLVFFGTASMYFYFCLIDAKSKRKYAIALTITNILIAYSHLSGFFLLFLQALYTLIIPSVRKTIFKEHLFSSLVLFITYLPYIIFMLSTAITTANYMSKAVDSPDNSQLYTFFWEFSNGRENFLIFLSILLAGTIAALITWKKITLYDKMILGWAIIPYFLMFAVSIKIRFNVLRFMIFITPGFYLAIMIAANYLSRFNLKMIGLLITIICIFYMVKNTDIKFSPYNLKASEAVAAVRKHKSDSTRVYIVPQWTEHVFAYHYNSELFKDYKNLEKNLNKDHIYSILTLKDMDKLSFDKVSDVLIIDGWNGLAIVDPKKKIYNTLLNKFGTIDTVAKVRGYTVFHFGTNKLGK